MSGIKIGMLSDEELIQIGFKMIGLVKVSKLRIKQYTFDKTIILRVKIT